jgi:hypothetical protein
MFFEEMGLYLKKGVLDSESIYEMYCFYIEHYWVFAEPRIKELRAERKDPTYFDKFELLMHAMKRHSRKRKVPIRDKADSDIRKFIERELAMQCASV